MICPLCKLNAYWVEYSSGGDGLFHCKCGWIENPTKTYQEEVEYYGK